MAKSLGNLFFTISANASKFDATVQRTQKKVQEFEKGTVKGQKNVQAETKKMSLGFAAAAGAAAAFAFELIKSSDLARFAMGVATDAVEAAIVGVVEGVAVGVDMAKKGYEDLGTASDHYAKRQKGSSKEVHDAAQEMGTGIEEVVRGINKVLPGPGSILDELTDKLKTQLPEGSRSGMGFIIEDFTRMRLDFGNGIYDMGVRWRGGVDTIQRRWGEFSSDLGEQFDAAAVRWRGGVDTIGARWGAFTSKLVFDFQNSVGLVVSSFRGMVSGVESAWAGMSWEVGAIRTQLEGTFNGFFSWLKDQWGNFWKGLSSGAGSAADWVKEHIPHFQMGGYVSSTGLALVHAGEQVIPAGQVNNYNQSNKSMTIPQIIVNVNSPQGLSFGGGVALGQDTRVAVVEAMRNVVGM